MPESTAGRFPNREGSMNTYISMAAIVTAITVVFWSTPSTPASYGDAQTVPIVLVGAAR
jgi:hypothetical protein